MSVGQSIAKPGRGRQRRYLSQPVILEEVGPPRLLRLLLLLTAFSVFAFVGWTAVTPLKETARAFGEVVPNGSVMAVQHLEGGIVSRIFVADGELVRQNAILVQLEPVAALAQLDELEARRTALSLRRERLRAFAEGRDPRFVGQDPRFAELVRDELSAYRQQKEALEKEREVLLLQAAQRESELDLLEQRESRLAQRIINIGKQKTMFENLVKGGHASQLTYLQTLEEYDSAVGDRAEAMEKIVQARSAIREAKTKITRLESNLRTDALSEASEVSAELASIDEYILRARDQVKRLDIRAPVRGIVKGLATRTVGGVVAPGGLITEIVPVDDELIVEARVAPGDIGHIAIGQKATVKITTFDFSQFGGVDGEVTRISASTFKDPETELYFKVHIRLAKSFVGNTPNENLILPGMVSEIDIITGQRTLLRYLLRPIFQALDASFTER